MNQHAYDYDGCEPVGRICAGKFVPAWALRGVRVISRSF